VRGRVQAANGVIHVVAEHLIDQSDLLRRVGGSDETFVIPAGREDEAVHGGGAGLDSRDAKALNMPRGTYSSPTSTSTPSL
jgi:error-prone DNA polymerase